MTDWISVNDRLPKPFVSVLLYLPDEAPYPTVREGYLVDEECGDGAGFYAMNSLLGRVNPTHWMPMPAPPEDDRKE